MQPANGQSNAYWVSRVRRHLRDQPAWAPQVLPADGTRGALVAGSQPFRLDKAPVFKTTAPPVVTGPGGPYAVVYDQAPGAGQAAILTETGELYFAAAPAVGSISVTYQFTKYSDTQLLEALTEGLDLLWPEIWSSFVDTQSVLVSPTAYEYNLPAQFQDPRTVMIEVEVAGPSAFVQYRRLSGWRIVNDVNQPKIAFSKLPGAGFTCRITYTEPYPTLSSTPEQVSFLPVYFALARIMSDQETMRVRDSDLPATSGPSAAPPGTSLDAARHWMTMFQDALHRLALDPPARLSVNDRAVERLNLGKFWQGAA